MFASSLGILFRSTNALICSRDSGSPTLVLPLAVPKDRPKGIIVFDLSADPEALLAEPADASHLTLVEN